MLGLLNTLIQNEQSHSLRTATESIRSEIDAASGDLDSAQIHAEAAAARHDSFSVRETSAYISLAADASGRSTFEQFDWLLNNSGRALVDCLEVCYERPWNIVSLINVRLQVARIYVARGDYTSAQDTLSQLPVAWREHPAAANIISEENSRAGDG